MEIVNDVTGSIIFASVEAKTVAELLQEALRAGVDVREANLSGADLSGADLSGADLRNVVLCCANLQHANLGGADLRYADLSGADLSMANLKAAELSEAVLYGANLHGSHAEVGGFEVIQITGLQYTVVIMDTYMQVGCQTHTFANWRNMPKRDLIRYDGKKAVEFYPVLMAIMDSLCADRESVADLCDDD